ncbi:MAG: FecR family protein, partial [Planctomycetia bacterium]|nr:FecR family protein [Planctomycetia bacterium]
MTDFRNNPYLLIDKYLAGDMSDEEQECFLDLVRENDQFADQVRKNVMMDILLFSKYCNTLSNASDERSTFDTHSSHDMLFAGATAIPQPDVNTVYVSPESVDLGPNGIYNDRESRAARFWTPRRVLLAIAGEALIVVSVVVGVLFICGFFSPHDNDFKSMVTVNQSIDAVWVEGTQSYKSGEESGASVMNLKSGLVKLTFARGAEVVLEGPTEFVVNDDSSCFCPRGTVHAFVPTPAIGFEIKTPFARVVDRGTEFSVKVNQNESRVDVIQGKVDLMSSPQSPPLALLGGQASRVIRDTPPQTVEALPSRYISPEDY